jgi:endonuclease/exonuclease/phosphatase family metal-dependent hydrolase
MDTALSLTLWNTNWAHESPRRARYFQAQWAHFASDVLAITEGGASLLPVEGHAIAAAPDYGYAHAGERRKVLLWSRYAWSEVDNGSPAGMPPGRLVLGRTDSPLGPVRVVSVCIPWRDAHVSTGRRDRQPWAEHLAYLAALGTLLRALPRDLPLLVVGDFNQRLPRHRQPAAVHQALRDALGPDLRVVTAGTIAGADALSIDHLACSQELSCTAVTGIRPRDDEGRIMSDHFGLRLVLRRQASR